MQTDNRLLNGASVFLAVVESGSFARAAVVLDMTSSGVSRAVATLQRHGRIEVVRDPANRRRKWLTLTDEGRRLYTIMRPQSGKVADYLFSELDSAEVAQLGTILTRLIDTLEAKNARGKSLFLERTKPE